MVMQKIEEMDVSHYVTMNNAIILGALLTILYHLVFPVPTAPWHPAYSMTALIGVCLVLNRLTEYLPINILAYGTILILMAEEAFATSVQGQGYSIPLMIGISVVYLCSAFSNIFAAICMVFLQVLYLYMLIPTEILVLKDFITFLAVSYIVIAYANLNKRLREELAKLVAEGEDLVQDARAGEVAKGRFLSTLSHEIRTPLNGVIGMLQVIRIRTSDAEKLKFIELALESARHLLTILNDTLDYSKLGREDIVLEEGRFKMKELISPVEQILLSLTAGRGLQNKLTVKGLDNKLYFGDMTRIRQILINLISNATKFTSKGAVEVIIEALPTSRHRDCIRIHVKDTGIGIPADKFEELFEPFKQIHEGSTRQWGGTGLGLSICKTIVDKLDGSIVVESVEGVGSTFRVSFELDYLPAKESTSMEEDMRPPSLKGKNLLIVDDSPVNRLVMEKILESTEADIFHAENGEELLDLVRNPSHKLDIILTDISMPIMDGLTAFRILRDDFKSTIPVIGVTGNAFMQDVSQYTREGMVAVVTKPVIASELFSALSAAMKVNKS